MKLNKHALGGIALGLLLIGCAGAPPLPTLTPAPTPAAPAPEAKTVPAPTHAFDVQARRKRAIELTEATDYRAALVQWKILQTLQPAEPEYTSRVRELEDLIAREVQSLATEGRQAATKDNPAAARRAWLGVLALDPNNQTALQVLRAIEEQHVKSIQAATTARVKRIVASKSGERSGEDKNQADYYLDMGMKLFEERDWQGSQREIEKYLAAYPDDAKARTLLAKVHQNLAAELENGGQLEAASEHLDRAKTLDKKLGKTDAARTQKIKHTIAEQYYQEALRAQHDSLDNAIVLLKKAVDYDPSHDKAQNQLRKALKMQKKLQNIKTPSEKAD